MLHENTKQ